MVSASDTPARQPDRFRNIVANYGGVAIGLLVSLGLVPLYVARLGTEAYGLVGFFTTLFSVLQVAELGLGTALNRELSRQAVVMGKPVGDLLRTVELVSGSMGAVVGGGIVLAAPLIAERWLRVGSLSEETVTTAVRWMGVAIGLQWSSSVYNGGLMGLERQVRAVCISGGANLVFALGATLLLGLWPDIVVFFVWRALVSAATVALQRGALRASLGAEHAAGRFDTGWLRDIWRFSFGMTIVSTTGVLLVQLDKLVVSKWLPLDEFGVYMVASTAASAIPLLVSPIFSVSLPALSRAVAADDRAGLERRFHVASGLIGALIFPIALGVSVFAEPLLLFWTRSADVARAAAPVLAILALGALLNAAMVPLYAVQLATGWTRLAVVTNSLMLVCIVPYGYFATSRWGALGAASIWLVLNALYVVFGSVVAIRRLLPRAFWRWSLNDFCRPLVQSAPPLLLAAWWWKGSTSPGLVLGAGVVILTVVAGNVLTRGELRAPLLARLRGRALG